MANKRLQPEEIITKLRQVDVLMGQRRLISNQAVLGRIDTVRALMASSEMKCSTKRYSTAFEKHRSSSNNGGNTTTQREHTVHWAIAYKLLKPSYHWIRSQ